MFDDLFTRPGIRHRYFAAPLFDERLSYLAHCAEGGARRGTLRTIAAHQVNLVHLLDLHEGERVSVTRIEAAAARWSLPGGRRCRRPAEPEQCRRFFGHTARWLRFVDMLEEPEGTRHSHAGEVAAFAAWMREERGWSEDTIHCCRGTVDRLFDWLDEWGVALASVEIADIDRAVARWHAGGLSRVTIEEYTITRDVFARRMAHRTGRGDRGLPPVGAGAPRRAQGLHPCGDTGPVDGPRLRTRRQRAVSRGARARSGTHELLEPATRRHVRGRTARDEAGAVAPPTDGERQRFQPELRQPRGALRRRALRPTKRLWAVRAPFESKDTLRARGYRWMPEMRDGIARAWWTDVEPAALECELAWLRESVYRGFWACLPVGGIPPAR